MKDILEKAGLHNTVIIEHRDAEGNLLSSQKRSNLIVNAGRDWLCGIMGSAAGNPAKYIALSSDGTAPAAADTTLTGEYTDSGLTRATGTYAHTTADKAFTLSKTFTCSASSKTVQKSGLFDAASPGTLFAEVTFTAVVLNSSDTLTVTWTCDLGL